jgi:WD40 repeat protein
LHESGIWQVGITPNRKFVSLGDDGLVVFRNIKDGKSAIPLYEKGAVLYGYEWLNGHTLIIVERLGKIISYDTVNQTKETLFETSHYRFRSLSLHPNRTILYIGTREGEIIVFDITSKKIIQVKKIASAAKNVTSIAFVGHALFVYTAEGVYRCNIDNIKITDIATIKNDKKLSTMVYNNNRLYLLYSFPAKVEVSEVTANLIKTVQTVTVDIKGKIYTVGSTPDNQKLFIVHNKTLCLADEDGRIYEKIDSFKQHPKSLFYKKDLLGIGDWNGAFSLLDTQNKPHLLPGHNSRIYAVAVKGNVMVTGSDFLEAQLRVWDTGTYKVQYIINGVSNKSIRTIAFLSKEHFVWGDAVGNIGLYNLNTRKKISLKTPMQRI